MITDIQFKKTLKNEDYISICFVENGKKVKKDAIFTNTEEIKEILISTVGRIKNP